MTDVFTPVIRQLAAERDELERHIARHKGLGPEYNAAAHVRIGQIDALEEKLYRERRRYEDKSKVGPTEGCTRCWCGAKYWDGDTCHSCGEKYHPDMDLEDAR